MLTFSARLIEASADEAGIVTGRAAVWGSENSNGVIFEAGAFKDWLDSGQRPAFLWQHDDTRPIGVVKSVDDGKDGLTFRAKITAGTPDGDAALAFLKDGAINGVSMGVMASETEEAPGGAIRVTKGELWELSLVTFPAEKGARVASVSKDQSAEKVESKDQGDERIIALEERLKKVEESAVTKPVITASESKDERLESFWSYVRSGAQSDLLRSAQSEGVAAAGGYLVPDEFAARIVERVVSYGGFASAATTINTSGGNPLTIAVTIDDSANLGAIVSEGGAFSSGADVVFGTVSLGAYTYASNGTGTDPVKVSWELLQDSAFDLAPMLGDLLGTRIGRIQSTHWITGDGANEPLGILTNKTAAFALADTTAPLNPTYQELLDLVHALDPGYRAGASWLVSDATLAAIRGMVDGANRPIWQPQAQSGIGTLPGGSLLGFPVIVDQAMPDIAASGSAKSIGFGDWRRAYTIRRVRDIGIVRLNELYATTRQTGFFAWARADGTVVDANAYVVAANHA